MGGAVAAPESTTRWTSILNAASSGCCEPNAASRICKARDGTECGWDVTESQRKVTESNERTNGPTDQV